MARILLSILLIIACSSNIFAQDKIVKTTNDTIEGKVIEINLSEIRYKKLNNIEGPTYVIAKSSIQKIIYENGETEIFGEESTIANSSNQSLILRNEEIVIRGNYFYYQGRRLGKSKLTKLIVSTSDPLIIEEYDRSKSIQTMAYVAGFAAIPAIYIGGMVWAYTATPAPLYVGFGLMNGLLIANNAMRHVYKNKRKHAIMMYNEHVRTHGNNEDYY